MTKKIHIDRGLEISPTELVPYDNNARTHSDKQVEQIMASMDEFTFTNAILVDENNTVLAGHGRLMAANSLNTASMPIDRIHNLSDAQKKAYALADNKMALNAGWDEELLEFELSELQEAGFAVDLIGFDDAELEDLIPTEGKYLTDPDDVPDPPKEPIAVRAPEGLSLRWITSGPLKTAQVSTASGGAIAFRANS